MGKVTVEVWVECAFCGVAYVGLTRDLDENDVRAVDGEEGQELMILANLPKGWVLAQSGDAYCPACVDLFKLAETKPLRACAWCGAPLFTEAKLCQNCWEEAGRADGGDKLDD